MKKNFSRRYSAFTLIELMFVITLFAVMALYTMNMLKNRQRNLSVAQTVNQINALFDQANRYYANYPTTITPGSVSIAQNLINAGYIQNADLCTVWPASSQTSNVSNTACPGKAMLDVIVNSVDPTNVPSSPIITHNSNLQAMPSNPPYPATVNITLSLPSNLADIANLIISKLPNALYVANQIQSWYNLPLRNISGFIQSGEINQYGYLTGGGWAHCNNKGGYNNSGEECDSIPLPNCQQGYEGHFIIFPYRYITDRWQYYQKDNMTTWVANKVFYQFSYAMDNNGNVTNPTSDNPQLTLLDMSTQYTNSDPKKSTGSGANKSNSFYITFCVPNNMWSSSTNRAWGQSLKKNSILNTIINCSSSYNNLTCEGQCIGSNGGHWYGGSTYHCGNSITK